ncbi:MAG: EamA family transporter [Rhodobacterales bacterium]|nr:MAG: EamA family transporter [Rhodobacterales bacterium]
MAGQAKAQDWAGLIALSLFWGASFMAVTVALEGFGPLQLAASRIVLGALVLTGFARAMGISLPPLSNRRLWLHIAGIALFSNAIPFFLLSWGQQHVASGFAGITMAVVPLFVLPLAHVFLPDEPLTPQKALGFGIGFAGVAVLIGPGAWASTGALGEGWARLACVGAAGCYAIGAIIIRRAPKADLVAVSASALIVSSLAIAPVALALEGLPALPGPRAAAAMIYLGLLPTALATVLLVRVIVSAGPGFLSLVNYFVPLWSVVFGVALLDEQLPASFIGALGLILMGLLVSRGRGSGLGLRRGP